MATVLIQSKGSRPTVTPVLQELHQPFLIQEHHRLDLEVGNNGSPSIEEITFHKEEELTNLALGKDLDTGMHLRIVVGALGDMVVDDDQVVSIVGFNTGGTHVSTIYFYTFNVWNSKIFILSSFMFRTFD